MFKKLGLQLYTVRDHMNDEKSLDETFEKLIKMGYTEGQTAGANVELPAYAELAKKHGMTIVGTHYDFSKIVNDPKATMALHDRLGTKNVGIGGMPGDARTSYDNLMKFIETFNKTAEIPARPTDAIDVMEMTEGDWVDLITEIQEGPLGMLLAG